MDAYEPKLDPNEEQALEHIEGVRDATYRAKIDEGATPRESIDAAKEVS